MSEFPAFVLAPPLRCCRELEDRPGVRCGDVAAWKARGTTPDPAGYFCDAHRRLTDEPLAGALLFRRVHLEIEIYIAGVSAVAGQAQAEAYELLEREIRRLGGRIGLLSLSSELGYGTAQAPERRKSRRPGGAE